MQKKSLLVALFCGALCLTGCLKNEESASVVQVRNAKANELNSIATLNEAKAAAELIYANADATLKAAEAELKKAEAALVLAMAETEKVRAELLRTQVALQEVKVEEEGIELLKKAAELEILLAKVEVEQAKAEAAKQYWANELAQLVADAEIASAENELELMKAEWAINEYILTIEGAKADSAKLYARKYFRAQEKVAELQVAELAARAASVLIENNAMSTREWIYNEIEKKNDTIAANEARIEALKKYLDVDPETAKANLEKAWTEYNVAYNDYQAKIKAKQTAWNEYDTIENKMEADFNNKSDNKTYSRKNGSKWYQDFKKPIQELFEGIYSSKHTLDVTVGETTVTVGDVGGIVVPSKENKFKPEFIPFWHNEAKDESSSRYPDKDVVMKDKSDYVTLKTTTIVPATIFYDNIQAALDTVLAIEGRKAARQIAGLQEDFEEDTAKVNKGIARKEAKLELHQAYIGARSANVEAAEEAFVTEVGKAKAFKKAKAEAWKEFQNYMVINFDETREAFMDRYVADTTYQGAVRDTLSAKNALIAAEAAVPEINIKEVFEDFVKAEGKYNKAVAYLDSDKWAELEELRIEAEKRWNPEFEAAILAGGVAVPMGQYVNYPNQEKFLPTPDGEGNDDKVEPTNGNVPGWKISGSNIEAGSAQDSLYTYNYNFELAKQKYYIALENTIRFPEGTADAETYADALEKAADVRDVIKEQLETANTGIEAKADDASDDYQVILYGEDLLKKPEVIAEAEKDYNPRFNDNKIYDICTFPTEGKPNAKYSIKWNYIWGVQYDWDNEEWWVMNKGQKEVAGDAQAELLDAVFAVVLSDARIQDAKRKYGLAMMRFYQADFALFQANLKLLTDLGGEIPEDVTTLPEMDQYLKDHIKDYIGDEADAKYEAYLAIEDESDIETAETALIKAYGFNPDVIGKLQLDADGDRISPADDVYETAKEAQFGWAISSYQLDYEATMINLDDELYGNYKVGEEIPVAVFLGDVKMKKVEADEETEEPTWVPVLDKNGKQIPVYKNSLAYQIEKAQKYVDVIAPKVLALQIKGVENELAGKKTAADDMMAEVNKYKTTESDYKAWVEDRMAAEQKYNQAQIDWFDAKTALNEAKAEYEAAEAAADGKVYLYNPWKKKFDYVSIPKAIEYIEGENEEIEGRIHELELELKYGKLAYQTIMQVLDETIQTLSADIEIWTAIANQYKAVMNAYLGIVEEEPVAEEPVDDEE